MNQQVDSLNINITNVSDYPLAIEAMYLQVFTCNYSDFSMSTDKPFAKDVRINLGTVVFSNDKATQRVMSNDEIYRIANLETGFFKLAYDYSAIGAALDCGRSQVRSRDIVSTQGGKKVGDVWLFVVVINPTNGQEVIIRKKLYPQ